MTIVENEQTSQTPRIPVHSALAQGHGRQDGFHSSDKHLLPGNRVQSCPGVISAAMIKYPDDKLLQRERVCLVFSSRWLSITAGKPRQLFRAPSCITFKSRERRNACLHACMPTAEFVLVCWSHSFTVQDPATRTGPPHIPGGSAHLI